MPSYNVKRTLGQESIKQAKGVKGTKTAIWKAMFDFNYNPDVGRADGSDLDLANKDEMKDVLSNIKKTHAKELKIVAKIQDDYPSEHGGVVKTVDTITTKGLTVKKLKNLVDSKIKWNLADISNDKQLAMEDRENDREDIY
jgi:hypothetical protein